MGKALPTLITAVRFLSCVYSLMRLEVVQTGKALPTLVTAVRFLSCVYSLMSLEAVFSSESLSAQGAPEPFPPMMGKMVLFKGVGTIKEFPTKFAK